MSSKSAIFPAIGEGEDVRLSGRNMTGAALVARNRTIHLSAFSTGSARIERASADDEGTDYLANKPSPSDANRTKRSGTCRLRIADGSSSARNTSGAGR